MRAAVRLNGLVPVWPKPPEQCVNVLNMLPCPAAIGSCYLLSLRCRTSQWLILLPALECVSVGIRCEVLDCRCHVLCELFWVTASVTYQNWNDTFSFWSTSFFRLTYSQSNFLIELQSSLSKALETVALWDSLIQTLELLHGQYMLSAKSWNNVSKELHCPGKVALSCPNF